MRFSHAELERRFSVPARTLGDWAKAKQSNWRYKMYMHLVTTLAAEKMAEADKATKEKED